jgi:hypothetical protein
MIFEPGTQRRSGTGFGSPTCFAIAPPTDVLTNCV